MDPELAHELTLKGLEYKLAPEQKQKINLSVNLFGLKFPSCVGLAAGFDKDATAVEALLRLGFGFVEVGTVTPRPQPGNPKPRMFRLTEDEGLINRLGFNSVGMDAVGSNLKRFREAQQQVAE